MKKPLLLLSFYFIALTGFSQKDKVYSSLEEALKTPDSVYILSLNNIKLNRLPEEFVQFTNLASLNLSGNKLSDLPDNLIQLKKLVEIDLSNNKFNTLPEIVTYNPQNQKCKFS